MNRHENELDDLFRAYRAACPDIEGSPGFVPGLWRRIEAKRAARMQLRHLSRLVLSGAAAMCLLMTGAMLFPSNSSPSLNQSYVDALAASQDAGTWSYAEALHVDIGETGPR